MSEKIESYLFDRTVFLSAFPQFLIPSSNALQNLSTNIQLPLVGVDEAGRGPLAGPVVAAAVMLLPEPRFKILNDSKLLTDKVRRSLFEEIKEKAVCFGISAIEPDVIDSINILQASLMAMRHSISKLAIPPSLVLIDGNQKCGSGIIEKAIVKGDQKSASIMAASILAKVTRDNLMEDYDRQYPEYGFRKNKGYGSAFHLDALQKFGPCPIHRKSFSPVRNLSLPSLSI